MNLLRQVILIPATLLGSWLGMQLVHESGHVLGAWMTGARVTRVVLHPLTISRTDIAQNPYPLVVVWCGPILGAAVPLLIWAAVARTDWSGVFVLRFFAGFCLIANGLYIGLGSLDGVGDCGEMLLLGSPLWLLWLFGISTAPLGFWIWHRQGRHFGLGKANEQINPRVAYGSLFACLALLILGFAVG